MGKKRKMRDKIKNKNSEKMIRLDWCVREVLFPYFSLYAHGRRKWENANFKKKKI